MCQLNGDTRNMILYRLQLARNRSKYDVFDYGGN